jgi:hypothetical protein
MPTRWYEYSDNPQSILHLFSEKPELQDVRIFSVNFSLVNNKAGVFIEPQEFPTNVPPRWAGKGFNAVHIEVDLFGVTSVELNGSVTDQKFNVRIEPLDHRFSAQARETRLSFSYFAFRISAIHGYKYGEQEKRGPNL